jgi:hypothetical protein
VEGDRGSAPAEGHAQASLLASVLEGQKYASAVRPHLAILDLHIHLHNFSNTQITERASGCFYRILCRVFPGLRAGADYLRYPID